LDSHTTEATPFFNGLLHGQRGLTTQRIAQQSPSRVHFAETDVHVPEISVQLAAKQVFTFDRNPQKTIYPSRKATRKRVKGETE